MKAPMIPSFRGLGNLRDMRDLEKALGTRSEGERELREELREEEKKRGTREKEGKASGYFSICHS